MGKSGDLGPPTLTLPRSAQHHMVQGVGGGEGGGEPRLKSLASPVDQPFSFAALIPAMRPKVMQSGIEFPPIRFVPWVPPFTSPAE